MRIQAIVVDDEELSLSYLVSSIKKHCPVVEVVATAANVKDAASAILLHRPDAVFLDIEMPGGNGFEILEEVPRECIPRFVFTTAHPGYAIRALREGATDYLLKPIKSEELKATCQRLQQELQAAKEPVSEALLNQRISVTHQSGFNLIRLAELVHLEADNNYTQLFLENGSHLTSSHNLGYFEQQLPAAWFLRIHRSHLINLFHLREYRSREGGDVILSTGRTLPVARSRMFDFLHRVASLGSKEA